jgi:hypothetical protein
LNRKILLLNLGLLALAGLLGRSLYQHYQDSRRQEGSVRLQIVSPKPVSEPPLPAPAKPVTAAEYFDVAQRMLFAKDRNPNVVIEPPPVKPEPPMPPLPVYYGQMALGEPVALLSIDKSDQKGYHAGDQIGEFKLVRFDNENIAFEWNGKTVERKLEQLVAKELPPAREASKEPVSSSGPVDLRSTAQPPRPQTQQPVVMQTPSPGTAASAAASGARSLGDSSGKEPPIGPEILDGTYACVPGDNSPSGTISNGLKKTMVSTPFGMDCKWVPTR